MKKGDIFKPKVWIFPENMTKAAILPRLLALLRDNICPIFVNQKKLIIIIMIITKPNERWQTVTSAVKYNHIEKLVLADWGYIKHKQL